MTYQQVPPEIRALRSTALALPYARLLRLPIKAVAEVTASSRRAIRNCRSTVKGVAIGALIRRKAARSESPPVTRRVDAAETKADRPDRAEIEAAMAERARCARIMRRGFDLGIASHAAALAFSTSLNPDEAVALVDRLASITNEA